jgi:hypothetical protein
MDVDALIVNRLHPRFGAPTLERDELAALDGPLGALVGNHRAFALVAAHEEEQFADLAARVAPAEVSRVPFFADDVHDLGGLARVEAHLFPPPGAGVS